MLRHLPTGRLIRLRPRTTIGRGPTNVMRLRNRLASSEHAMLSWSGDTWTIRDLGSRNGTWHGDRKLLPGETITLERGQTLAFGDGNDRWQIIEVAPPQPFAEAITGDAVVDAIGGILALPSSADPQLTIYASGDGWFAEDDTGLRPVSDQEIILTGDTPWRLAVPEIVPRTITAAPGRFIAGLALRLRVSRDQEYVEVSVRADTDWITLAPRAYHYMLVVLAEERLADATASRADRGWLHMEDLADKLGQEPRTLNVHVCRLRQQLGQLGFDEAASIVERRPGTGQIRLGTDAVELGAL